MAIRVIRTITDHTNGRRENPNSPTGWERRTGEVRYTDAHRLMAGGRKRPTPIAIWEPCEPPQTYVVGSEAEAAREKRGGTIETVIEGVEEGSYYLIPDEAESLLRLYIHQYHNGMSVFRGTVFSGGKESEMKPHEGHAMAEAARQRVLMLFGIDLAETNVG